MLNKSITEFNEAIDEPDTGKTDEVSLQRHTSVIYDFQWLDDLQPKGPSEGNKVIY